VSDVRPVHPPEEMARRREIGRQIARSADRSVLLLCVLVLGMSFLLHPGMDFVSLGSWHIPTLCFSRRMFDIECPGCGLTRSFVFFAHFDPVSAWQVNKLGIPMYLGVLLQVPLRAWRIWGR
jgi:hypothetical protein